jgi:hypothetical protein
VKSGKLKLLAVTEDRRSKLLPDVPTVGETLRGYEMAVWYGVWVPAATPPEIVARLNAEVNRAMVLPDVQQPRRGCDTRRSPAGAAAEERCRAGGWIIREANIKADARCVSRHPARFAPRAGRADPRAAARRRRQPPRPRLADDDPVPAASQVLGTRGLNRPRGSGCARPALQLLYVAVVPRRRVDARRRFRPW